MTVSILHRVTGDGMALVGSVVMVWWLVAMASGGDSYNAFLKCADSPFGYIVLVGLTWSFFQHMCSGLRHFVLDAGAGYELGSNRMWSIATLLVPLFGTAAVWLFILYGRVAG